ncbi:MAG: hypothetical protein ACOC8K_09300, partial [Gemmatimonadota bacterium]
MSASERSSLRRIAFGLLLIATGIGGSILLWAPGSGSAAPVEGAESVLRAAGSLESVDLTGADARQAAPIVTGPL